MTKIIDILRTAATAAMAAVLVLQPGIAAAAVIKVQVQVGNPGISGAAGASASALTGQSSPLSNTLALPTLSNLPAVVAPTVSQGASVNAAASVNPTASMNASVSAVPAAAVGRVQAAPSAAASPRAAAQAVVGTTPERKAVAKELGQMQQSVADLPKVSAGSAASAHGSGVDLENLLTRRAVNFGAAAVVAPSAVGIGSSRSGLKAAAAFDEAGNLADFSGAAKAASAYEGEANPELQGKVEEMGGLVRSLRDEVGKVIVGQQDMLDSIIVAMIAGEHVLLEGLPGIAKTLTVNTFADATGAKWSRIQMTPDLLPKSITGGQILQIDPEGKRTMEVQHGPVMGVQMVLADEINRATPRTQAALLEIMQERQITIAGKTYKLAKPFLLLATQNPVEQEGTNPLPEAQQDRFMYKVTLDQPNRDERKIVNDRMRTTDKPKAEAVVSLEQLTEATGIAERIYMAEDLRDYIQNLLEAVLDPSAIGIGEKGLVRVAMITRASIMMEKAARINALMNGRSWVTPEDIREIAPKILRHRILMSFTAGSMTTDSLIAKVLDRTPITAQQFTVLKAKEAGAQALKAAQAQSEKEPKSGRLKLVIMALAAAFAAAAAAGIWWFLPAIKTLLAGLLG